MNQRNGRPDWQALWSRQCREVEGEGETDRGLRWTEERRDEQAAASNAAATASGLACVQDWIGLGQGPLGPG